MAFTQSMATHLRRVKTNGDGAEYGNGTELYVMNTQGVMTALAE